MIPQCNNQYDYLKDKKHWGKNKKIPQFTDKTHIEGGGTVDMSLPADAGNTGSIPGLERFHNY